MFKNYLKVAFRNLTHNRAFSLINIAGLVVGIATFIFIMLWVHDELSFDKFHENRDVVHRVILQTETSSYFQSPAPLGPAVISDLPEVTEAARIRPLPRLVFAYNEQSYYEDNGMIADPSLFEMLNFPLVQGSLENVFNQPDFVVITESMAHKYFGDDDPINQQFNVDGRGALVVSGVLKDIPANSHLQFDYVVPYSFLEYAPIVGTQWGDFNFQMYVQLNPSADPADVQEKITQVAWDNYCPQIRFGGGIFTLQSLDDMYLHPVSNYDLGLGNIRYIYIFSAVALLILIIASINFINLSTARAMTRIKEVGIRKIVGADRRHISLQLWIEFMLLAGIALVIALALLQGLMPSFNQLTGKQLHLDLTQPRMLVLIAVALMGSGVLAGLYPAISMSLFQPIKLLQKQGAGGSNSPFLRRLLVTGQFTLSILLIVCTLIVSQQMNFVQSQSWNLEDDLVVHVPIKENIGTRYDVVKEQLLQDPNIVAVSAKDDLPTTIHNITTGVRWTGKTDAQTELHIETIRVTPDYFTTLGLDMIDGQTFAQANATSASAAYILNEDAVKQTGLTDPVGKEFALYDRRGPIIGVVEDSYFQTMKQPKQPQAFYLFTDLPAEGSFGSLFIRISNIQTSGDLQPVISHIESVWKSVNQVAPFEYHFLDETIQAQYFDEQRLMRLFSIFSSLAIAISCLGLYGLAAFIAKRRTKEIGIRKVLGSTVSGVVVLLSRSFTGWVLFANLIAWPIAYYAMNRWLQNFAYRIDLTIWPFLLAGVAALAIALLTVSWQTVRAATANPVESLRYE